jgi:hypothetical protein
MATTKPDAATIINALVEYFHEVRAVSQPVVVARLCETYGPEIVHRALHRHLRQQNRSLKRQVRQARAAWIKRTF